MLDSEEEPTDDSAMIVLNSEEFEEPIEKDDSNMFLNPVYENEPDNEHNCSSSVAYDNEEDNNSMYSSEAGGTISAILQPVSCSNQPEIYSESDIQSAITCGDFGKVVQVDLTDHQKFSLLKKPFVPSPNYKFPTRIINSRQRHFQHSWLKSYPGLVYSESQNGGYCKYCVLFGKCEATVKEMGVFINRPFTNFKKASELLGSHFHGFGNSKGNKTHQKAVGLEDSSLRIDYQLSTLHSKKVAENCLKL